MKKIFALSFSFLLFFVNFSYSSECETTATGKIVCANGGGTAIKTNTGDVVCGLGQCVITNTGSIVCSKKMSGSVTVNNIGEILCVGGCEYASKNNCSVMEKFK